MSEVALNYELDGVPADLMKIVQGSASVRASLLRLHATGLRLVRMPNGWSNPRLDLKSDDAYEMQILGRPGKENDVSSGPWGQCYVKINGEWKITQLSVC